MKIRVGSASANNDCSVSFIVNFIRVDVQCPEETNLNHTRHAVDATPELPRDRK